MLKDLQEIFGAHPGMDERSVSSLVKALEKNNLPGFDYIEFKQSLSRLSAMSMDEATAFKSTFATASTVGLTKDKLLKTADHYRKVLMTEKQQFDVALENQLQQRVKNKVSEVAALKQQIEDYRAKIKELEAKITKAQATVDQADRHIQESQDKLESTKHAFESTLRSILDQIERDIANINNYL